MGNDLPVRAPSWTRSRYGFAAFWFGSLLGGWMLFRLVLLFAFTAAAALSLSDVVRVIPSGLHRDVFAALVETIPLLLWFLIVPERWVLTNWHRRLFWTICFILCFAQIFLLFVEFFFFEEFKSRFNTVAVDYLLYPQEVFVNIWESYHVGVVVLICLGLSLVWWLAARRLFARMWERPFFAKSRLLHFAAAGALIALITPAIDFKAARVSHDRTLNEVANNGVIAFAVAAWTHHLDYIAFYKTLPRDEAY